MIPEATTVHGATAPGAGSGAVPVLAYAAACFHSTPTTWDAPVDLGPRVTWNSGAPRRAYLGAHAGRGQSAWAQSVEAGNGFACAKVTGLNYGPLSLPLIIVTCIGEHYAVRIEGGAAGRALHPGEHVRIEGLEIDVGRVERHQDGSHTITGLSISSPAAGLMTVAVAHCPAS